MATISGSIERIVFRNSETGFCVARLQPADDVSGTATVVGVMPNVQTGEMLSLIGAWQIHPVHGRNFRIERFEAAVPDSAAGIERYLAAGVIRGVGPVTAARIVEHFGERTLNVLDSNPGLLREVAGISAKRAHIIADSWKEQTQIRDLGMFLQEHGISVALANRIYQKYGRDAVEIIRTDPYRLALEVPGIGFKTADATARMLGMSKRSVSRYVAGLKYSLSRSTDDGHVFLQRGELLARGARLLDAPVAELEPALLELIQRGDAVIEDEAVYLAPFYTAETGIALALRQLLSTASSLTLDRRFDASRVVTAAAASQGLELAAKQLQSVEQALGQKVSILTGGPGTGKTSTLRTVIAALNLADASFCICAPTGRAAKRVTETTGCTASTIHRLLEFQPGLNVFNYDRDHPLPYDFVIVDETSMLDVLLFYHLLKAIPPESHLLLVGDADQLPAVGPGNVLRDLLSSGAVPHVCLTELFRQAQGSQIVLVAHAINNGKSPVIGNRTDDDLFFIREEDDLGVTEVIKGLLHDRIPTSFGLDPIEDIQVLAPMHSGRAGVTMLNEELQSLLNPESPTVPELRRGDRTLRLGDKVMQIRNNYDKDVYNGDVGRVSDISVENQRLTVTYPSGTVSNHIEYDTGSLDELVLAYAVSVHKAQGSEFPCVVMPIVPGHSVLLQRSLLYTAITRARQLCVLVGSPRTFELASRTNRRQLRNTRLARRLEIPSESLQPGLRA